MTDSYWLGKSVCYNHQVSNWLEWIMIVLIKRSSILHINLLTLEVIKGFINWLTRVDSSHPVYELSNNKIRLLVKFITLPLDLYLQYTISIFAQK
jgi:hypothetical protein